MYVCHIGVLPQYFWDENVDKTCSKPITSKSLRYPSLAESWPSMLVPAGICLKSAGKKKQQKHGGRSDTVEITWLGCIKPLVNNGINYQSQLVS